MQEQRQRHAALLRAFAGRVDHAVLRRRVIALRGLLQHVADVDDQHAEVAGHVDPLAILALHLQARLVGRRQDGQQVDVAVRGRAQRAGRLVARQRRIPQHPQQRQPAVLDHVGQRLAIVLRDLRRRVLLHPRQQLRRQVVGDAVVAHRIVLQRGRNPPPWIDVEVLLDVLLRVALGGLRDLGGEVAVLRLLGERQLMLLGAIEIGQPVRVDLLDQVLGQGVIHQDAEACLVQGAGELLGRIRGAVVDDSNLHVGSPVVPGCPPFNVGAVRQREVYFYGLLHRKRLYGLGRRSIDSSHGQPAQQLG